MAFFDFFKQKENPSINAADAAVAAVQSAVAGIDERLAEISERLRRIENKQKETSLQIEEIDDFLQGGGESTLVDALIALTDTIGDFYHFAGADADSPFFEQARMMWNAAKSAVEAAGLEIIDACREPFDFHRHSVEETEQDNDMPNGYVIKALKCGYVYKDKIVRRAAVVVNKTSALIVN